MSASSATPSSQPCSSINRSEATTTASKSATGIVKVELAVVVLAGNRENIQAGHRPVAAPAYGFPRCCSLRLLRLVGLPVVAGVVLNLTGDLSEPFNLVLIGAVVLGLSRSPSLMSLSRSVSLMSLCPREEGLGGRQGQGFRGTE